MNLGKKYKQLFEGKVRSNDAKLLKENAEAEIDALIDWKEVQKANDHANRNEYNMYEDGEEIVIPLRKPWVSAENPEGISELNAEVYKDSGFTSFSLFSSSVAALEAMGIDMDDFADWMQETMMA